MLLLRSVSIEGWSSSHPKLMTGESGSRAITTCNSTGTRHSCGTFNMCFCPSNFVDILLALSQHDDSKGVFNKNPEKLMSFFFLFHTWHGKKPLFQKQLMQFDEMFLETLLSKMCRKGMVTLHYCDGVMSADIQAWLGMSLDGVCSS